MAGPLYPEPGQNVLGNEALLADQQPGALYEVVGPYEIEGDDLRLVGPGGIVELSGARLRPPEYEGGPRALEVINVLALRQAGLIRPYTPPDPPKKKPARRSSKESD